MGWLWDSLKRLRAEIQNYGKSQILTLRRTNAKLTQLSRASNQSQKEHLKGMVGLGEDVVSDLERLQLISAVRTEADLRGLINAGNVFSEAELREVVSNLTTTKPKGLNARDLFEEQLIRLNTSMLKDAAPKTGADIEDVDDIRSAAIKKLLAENSRTQSVPKTLKDILEPNARTRRWGRPKKED